MILRRAWVAAHGLRAKFVPNTIAAHPQRANAARPLYILYSALRTPHSCMSPKDREIDVLIRARYPIIYIVSYEEARVEDAVRGVVNGTKQVQVWSATEPFAATGPAGRGIVSSGKAAQLLGMARWEFVRYASQLGIAFFDMTFDMTDDEWQAERTRLDTL